MEHIREVLQRLQEAGLTVNSRSVPLQRRDGVPGVRHWQGGDKASGGKGWGY